MAYLLPILQFFDDKGDVLVNGTVTCYLSETSTLQDAYTDATGNTALENPVLLDSHGRPQTSGSIWLDGIYTFVVQDVNGNIINEARDQVSGFIGGETVDYSSYGTTITELNYLLKADPGLVVPSALIAVDSIKDIKTFRNLTGSELEATTKLKAETFKDGSAHTALAIIPPTTWGTYTKVTAGATANAPQIGGGNYSVNFESKGAGHVIVGNKTINISSDGSPGPIVTNGSNSIIKGSNNHLLNPTSASYDAFSTATHKGQPVDVDVSASSFTSGVQVGHITLTPATASSKFLIFATAQGMINTFSMYLAVYTSPTATSPISAVTTVGPVANRTRSLSLQTVYEPGTTETVDLYFYVAANNVQSTVAAGALWDTGCPTTCMNVIEIV